MYDVVFVVNRAYTRIVFLGFDNVSLEESVAVVQRSVLSVSAQPANAIVIFLGGDIVVAVFCRLAHNLGGPRVVLMEL